MERLLTLSNGAALHRALKAAGAPVGYRTVARWVGDAPESKPDPELLPYLETVFGTTNNEPPEPAWLEGLVREVRMNRAVIQAAMAGADPAFVSRVLDRLGALESRPTLSGGEAPDPIDAAT